MIYATTSQIILVIVDDVLRIFLMFKNLKFIIEEKKNIAYKL